MASGSTFIFYLLEKAHNVKIGGLIDALYFCVSMMTGVGASEISPVTSLGELFGMGLMLLGTALYVCFVATVADALMDFEMKEFRIEEKKAKLSFSE